MTIHRVDVRLPGREYPVLIGHGAVNQINQVLPPAARRAIIVTQEGIPANFTLPIESKTVVIGQGETAKSLATIEDLSQQFAEMGITRQDVIIGVGGGMVTDVAGFAAATWHRGTPVVHVATSLLAMVDAAIGGKTGVNLPQGKNLVGAFWQPSAVICDLDFLSTLPERELRCGLGEVAKYHFLTGDDLLSLSLDERVARCVSIKGAFVEQDERESGKRAFLNYGHTLAHALETVGKHQLAHGEAVAIGLIFAARLARALGRIDDARVDYHELVVGQTYSLQTRMPSGLDINELLAAMARDKKALNGLTFILDSSNGLEIVSDISADVVRSELVNFSQA
ncbi:MAG: 3-dehydroquinate synthase [Actinomycetota bacterium]|jgi:5-deoxy-5-amino-3-dehydroquinate synthase